MVINNSVTQLEGFVSVSLVSEYLFRMNELETFLTVSSSSFDWFGSRDSSRTLD